MPNEADSLKEGMTSPHPSEGRDPCCFFEMDSSLRWNDGKDLFRGASKNISFRVIPAKAGIQFFDAPSDLP